MISLLLFPMASKATHIVGGAIGYRCLGNNTYEITLHVYRDCGNIKNEPFDTPAYIAIYDGTNRLIETLEIPYMVEDTLSAGVFDTCLVAPSNVCVSRTMFRDTVTLAPNPIGGFYEISYVRCCRNATIENIYDPLFTGAVYDIMLTEKAMEMCNTSPVFRSYPPVFICVNTPIVWDHAANDDADMVNDSIVYKLCTPKVGGTFDDPKPIPPKNPPPYDTLVWKSPLYTRENMLGIGDPRIGVPLRIDLHSGLLTGLPTIQGQFVVGVCIEEYDKESGALLSRTRRDFQYNVGICMDELELEVSSTNCSESLDNFSISFATNADIVNVDVGELEHIGGRAYVVRNIPANTNATIFYGNTEGSCMLDTLIAAPDCSCEANVVVNPPLKSSDISVCSGDILPELTAIVEDGETVDWYDVPVGGTPLAVGTTTFATNVPGTYYAEARDTISGCTSPTRTPIILEIKTLPDIALANEGVVCAMDLATYMVTFSTNAEQIMASAGSLANDGNGNYTVSGIPIETVLTLTLSNTSTNCTRIEMINPPDCNCSMVEVKLPVSGGNATICEGEVIPELTATVEDGVVVDWYDASINGNLLLAGSNSYTPTQAGIYYAEARSIMNDCTSPGRTPVELVIHELPRFDLIGGGPVCAEDLKTYSVTFASDAQEIVNNAGVLASNGEGIYSINNIPAGTDLILFLNNPFTTCSREDTIKAPDCSCINISVNPPVSAGNKAICSGDTLPALVVSVEDGITVDWYDAPVGGNLLLEGSPVFTPSTAGKYYAASRISVNNCTSTSRTEVELTIYSQPQFSLDGDGKVCAEDLKTYQVTFSTDANDITVSAGVLTGNGGGSFTVMGIDTSVDVVITLVNTTTNCSREEIVQAPNCSCDGSVINPPVSGGGVTICMGDSIPALMVTVEDGQLVDWYDAPVGGNLLLSNSNVFNPTIAGTYYAETRQEINDCTSSTRTAVALTINELPSVTVSGDGPVCAADLLTYSLNIQTNADEVVANNGTVTNNGGGSFTIAGIPSGIAVEITARNGLTTCQAILNVNAPVCSCENIEVSAPVSGGDRTFCEGDVLPALSASTENGVLVDWYDAPAGGNLLLAGSNTFLPATPGTYYAEARVEVNNCTSVTRTAVVLSMIELPSFELNPGEVTCAEDLESYQVIFTTNATNVIVNSGTVTQNGNGKYTISGIANGVNLEVTLSGAGDVCKRVEVIEAPDCSCEMQIVNPPVSGGDQEACANSPIPALTVTVGPGETADWYDAMENGNLLASGTTSFVPSGAGTYYAETRVTVNNCTSSQRVAVTLTVNEIPTYAPDANGGQCDADLQTYSFDFATNADMVTSDLGDVVKNLDGTFSVNGIPVGSTATITLTFTGTNCSRAEQITSPDCPCELITVNPPVSEGNRDYCEGSEIPALTVRVEDGETVDWYDAPTGGNLLLAGSTTYTPTGAGTYYAETRKTINGCTSNMRRAVTLTQKNVPTFNLVNMPTCAVDLESYSITFTTDANDITVNAGTLRSNGAGNFTVENIPPGRDLTITLAGTATGCVRTEIIEGNQCKCEDVVIEPPVSEGDKVICEGAPIPALSVTVSGGVQVDWYDAAEAGNLLASNTTSFTPAMAGVYYAESRHPENDCISNSRTPVALVVNPMPSFEMMGDSIVCNNDGETYQVIFKTNGDTVIVNFGILVNNGDSTFTVNNIPRGQAITINIIENTNGCSRVVVLQAPDCMCIGVTVNVPVVEVATIITCEGDPAPIFTATITDGDVVDWYDAPVGGNRILANSLTFTPSEPGVYYASGRNPQNDCTSDVRVPVNWQRLAIPSFETDQVGPQCATDQQTYRVVFSTDAGFVEVNTGNLEEVGSGDFLVTGIPVGVDLVITLMNTQTDCPKTETIQSPECRVICEEPFIFVPSAFTPNGDNNNDVFRVRSEVMESLKLIIYNRWGEEIYFSEDQAQGWDGTFRGQQLPPDVYGFYLQVVCFGGDTFTKKGNITLIR